MFFINTGFAETVSKKFKGHRKEKERKLLKKKKKEVSDAKGKKSLFRTISSKSKKCTSPKSPKIVSKPM